jgi:hypothetical protein
MSEVTDLASSQVNGHDTITVELIEADETPAVVIIRWPNKASVIHPHRFPDTAATLTRLFAEAATALAAIKARRKL